MPGLEKRLSGTQGCLRAKVISFIANPIIKPLGAEHNSLRAGFSCGEGPLDQYLKQQASQDAKKYIAAPYVMVLEGRIAGFYTLSASSINISDLPSELVKQLKLPRYPKIGVTLIGRLARDLSFKGLGIGAILLIDALKRALNNSASIGSMAVVVDSKNDNAHRFYTDVGFLPFPDTRERLFMPMKTIEQLVVR